MREIIFRGKRKNNGKWIYGSLVNDGKDCYIYDPTLNKPFLACMIPVIPESIEQFTGQLDKNGVKIFEGDEIEITWGIDEYDSPIMSKEIITYSQCDFGFNYGNNPLCELTYDPKNGIKLEVIGNVHDKEVKG